MGPKSKKGRQMKALSLILGLGAAVASIGCGNVLATGPTTEKFESQSAATSEILLGGCDAFGLDVDAIVAESSDLRVTFMVPAIPLNPDTLPDELVVDIFNLDGQRKANGPAGERLFFNETTFGRKVYKVGVRDGENECFPVAEVVVKLRKPADPTAGASAPDPSGPAGPAGCILNGLAPNFYFPYPTVGPSAITVSGYVQGPGRYDVYLTVIDNGVYTVSPVQTAIFGCNQNRATLTLSLPFDPGHVYSNARVEMFYDGQRILG